MTTTTSYHVCIQKSLLLTVIRNQGAAAVLVNFTGTDAEAIASLNADPREWISCEPCDRQAPDGHCLGHPEGL